LALLAGCGHSLEIAGPLSAGDRLEAQNGDLREFFSQLEDRSAYGEYLPTGAKIGWKTVELKIGVIDGREAAIFDFEYAFPSLRMRGAYTVAYELENEGPICFVSYVGLDNEDRTTITVRRQGEELVAVAKVNGLAQTYRYPLSRDTLSERKRFYSWLYDDEERSPEFELTTLNLERIEEGRTNLDQAGTFTVAAKQRVVHDGQLVDCLTVSAVGEEGEATSTDYLPQGVSLRHSDGFLESRLEEETIAKQVPPLSGLIAESFRMPIDQPLGSAAEVERLVVKLAAPAPLLLPTSHRQRVIETLEQGVVVEVVADSLSPAKNPLTAAEKAKYLSPTIFIQSEHPTIVALAERIRSKRTEPLEIADAIKFWISMHIDRTSTADSSSALTVLQNKRGDCTEHTILAVALARALGIPAREVSGLVYASDDEQAFGWHAWAELHDGRRWISVDPMFHQLLVDATHIKLSDGNKDQLGPLMGRLRIEVEEFELRDANEAFGLDDLFLEMVEYEDLLSLE
jgi:hypothetical protein